MPTPREGESRDDFVSRCIPIVLDDGTAESNDQAVAICNSMYEGKTMNVQQKLIEAIKGRKRQPWGGMRTADEYVRTLADTVDASLFCESTGDGSLSALMRKQAGVLTHTDDKTMTFETKLANDIQLPDGAELPPNTLMLFRHVITSNRKDRDGDVLRPDGAEIDPKLLLLWQHVPTLPIGKLVAVDARNSSVIKFISAIVDMNALCHDAAVMIENKMGRFSHGFTAFEFDELKEPEVQPGGQSGFDVKKWAMLEESLVSIPSNVDAEQEDVLLSLVGSKQIKSEIVTRFAKRIQEMRPKQFSVTHSISDLDAVDKLHEPPQKEVKTLRKMFDIGNENVEPSKIEFDWAARFLGCSVKDICIDGTSGGGVTRASLMEAYDQHTSIWDLHDTRNLNSNATEEPPQYETIQLNSKHRKAFLVRGIRFYVAKVEDKEFKLCVKTYETWGGQVFTFYCDKQNAEHVTKFIDTIWEWVETNHLLKGEAFSLTGNFISRDGTKWDELFLPKATETVLTRTTKAINAKGKEMTNRGVILMGPPGTGKTLSGRVMLNEAKATFIWISAKDFWRAGAMGGLANGFELARKLSPAILFIEDVDNWMSERTVDLIKTEMDGIARSSGVVTMLTTNYPERLPKALIDRPGRFHEVLEIGLPGKDVRRRMIQAWVPDVDHLTAEKIAEKTAGFSGAHLYELAFFAQTLREDEEMSVGDSLEKAIDKIESQREAIDAHQLGGSKYEHRTKVEQPTLKETSALSSSSPSTSSFYGDFKEIAIDIVEEWDGKDFDELINEMIKELYVEADLVDTLLTKAGRVLSKRNLQALVDVKDHIEEMKGMDGLNRAHKAICEKCVGMLDKVIKEASGPDEEDMGKAITAKEAGALLLREADEQTLKTIRDAIDTMFECKESERIAEEYRTLVAS